MKRKRRTNPFRPADLDARRIRLMECILKDERKKVQLPARDRFIRDLEGRIVLLRCRIQGIK